MTTLRDATLDDSEFLYRLRTDPDVAAASNRAAPPSLAEHTAWLMRALDNPDVKVFIVEQVQGSEWAGLVPIGQCRLDMLDYGWAAEVSVSLIRSARGNGIGTATLRMLAHRATDLGVRWLEAVIRESNIASRKAFLKAGYSVEEIGDGLVHMGLKCGI